MNSGGGALDFSRPFRVLVRKAPRKDELVIYFFRNREVFGTAFLTVREGLKPSRCRLRIRGIDAYMQPKELLSGVGKARQIILIPDRETLGVKAELESAFPGPRPVWARPCRYCLMLGRVRFPRKPIRYGVDSVCAECAKSQLTKEAQSKGWKPSEASIKYLGRLLERTGDYDLAWRTLSADYDPDRDASLSLYDIIEEKKVRGHEPPAVELDDLYADEPGREFSARLRDLGIGRLLPVQAMAIGAGLLDGRNLMIVSSTSSGKTLVGEMAGIPRAMSGAKFLYLTPLVALANLRYSEFSNKYGKLGLKVAIKVGVGRIRTAKEPKLNQDVEGSQVIVGTYEGVEQLLRSGSAKKLGKIGVVAIDEVQNLADPDRGARLDGLVKKLRVLFPEAQLLYLSATVGNPEALSKRLGAGLVLHDERPVPLERHLVPVSSPGQKIKLMSHLVAREFGSRSPEGYRGQTLIFTNSRRNCHRLASTLSSPGCPLQAYHSGLSYGQRRAIEKSFLEQRIAALATTSALAAGVDLPASQVIFETLAMGMDWVTPAEFHQMLGRAGRLGYHGYGRAMLLIEPGRSFSRAEKRTEDEVALDLLSSEIDPVVPSYTHEDMVEQVLSDVSTFGMLSREELDRLQDYSVGFSSNLGTILDDLLRSGMVRSKGNSLVITPLGRLSSSYFLSIEQSAFMARSVRKGLKPMEIAVGAQSFDRAYVSESLQRQIEQAYRRRISIRFFDSDLLDILSRPRRMPSRWFREVVGRVTVDLLRCRCRGSPHCDCPPRKLSEVILKLRIAGNEPEGISKEIFKRYGIEAYPGDVLEYLNDIVRLSEAITRFAEILGKPRLGDESKRLGERIIG
jgi:helicase